MRNINADLKDFNADEKLEIISNNLRSYIHGFRNTFLLVKNHLPSQSDLTVNGLKTIDELTEELVREIKNFASGFKEDGNFS